MQFGLAAERTIADNNTLTLEPIAASIAELEGRLAKSSTLSFKVSEKGAMSIYGLGRFDELRAFMAANKSKLKLKEQPQR